ncbi:MAG: ABC transporter substrate-binding protein [Pleomorphochaeta sp.]
MMKKCLIIFCSFFFVASLGAKGVNEENTTQKYGGEEGKITAYISGPENMLKELEKTFEEERGDVLDIVQLGCGPLRQRVWAESETGCINADVFWGSDPLLYEALADKGLLEDYKPKGYENIDDKYKSDKPYVLVSERFGVIIYNKDKVNSDISSYNDLLDKDYYNQIVHSDPAQSSTALAIIASLWDLEDGSGSYYSKLIENGLFLAKKNSDVPSKIQEGEFLLGIAPHDAVWRLQKLAIKKGYETPLAISWPKEGAIAIQRPVAISKNINRYEENEVLSQEFVDFLISEKAQNIILNYGFISVLKDFDLPAGLSQDIVTLNINWEDLAKKQYEINEDFEKLY